MLACIPGVLAWPEVKKLRQLADAGQFVDGGWTAGAQARNVKANEQLRKTRDQRRFLDNLILGALRRNATFQRVTIPRHVRSPTISRYGPGMAYGTHVDNALMGKGTRVRADLSVTLFLSQPDTYDGGELVVESPFGTQEVKLPAGAAVVYPASSLHRVGAVTRGERLAAVTWVQSYVREAPRREVLHDLRLIKKALAEQTTGAAAAELAQKTYSNLLRMWSET